MTKDEFVNTYWPAALDAQRSTGVPAIFALAQSALETGWGKHTPGNLMFGLKVGSGRNYGGYTGQVQWLTTTEYASSDTAAFPYIYPGYPIEEAQGRWKYRIKDKFRAYPSPKEAFVDWAGLLSSNARYQKALQVKEDPFAFTEAIAKAGYATDPFYAEKVQGVMRQIMAMIHTSTPQVSSWRWVMPVTVAAITLGAFVWYTIRNLNR